MKPDAKFKTIKDIPLMNGNVIKAGSNVYRVHGCYYLETGILPPSYQEDFEQLIEDDSKREPKYIVKMITKEL